MPVLPPVPGVLRFQLQYDYGADINVLNRFFVAYTGAAPTSAQLNTVATAVNAAWVADLKPLYNSGQALTGVFVEDLTSALGGVGSNSTVSAGSRAGATMPAGVSALINFHVARRYRGGKPRMYSPFGTATDLNSAQTWAGTFTAAVVTGWNAFVTAVIAAAPGGTVFTGQVNVSYYQGFTTFLTPSGRYRNIPKLRVGGPVVDTVQSVSCNSKFASQRRRNQH